MQKKRYITLVAGICCAVALVIGCVSLVLRSATTETRFRERCDHDLPRGMMASAVESYLQENSFEYSFDLRKDLNRRGVDTVLPGHASTSCLNYVGRYHARIRNVGAGLLSPRSLHVYVFMDGSNRVCGTHVWGNYEL